MESALSQNQFLVYLQPKYRIKDEVLVGAEALVRWNHPVWGFLSPAEFIPLFEKNGFITRLDRFVWGEGMCAVLHDWDEQGILSHVRVRECLTGRYIMRTLQTPWLR